MRDRTEHKIEQVIGRSLYHKIEARFGKSSLLDNLARVPVFDLEGLIYDNMQDRSYEFIYEGKLK